MSKIFEISIVCLMVSLLGMIQPELQTSGAKSYYVSLEGKDTNPGTIEKPFLTLEKALQFSHTSTEATVKIYLRGGIYEIKRTLSLNSSKSNTRQEIEISAFSKEKVKLIGGHMLDMDKFRRVTDPKSLQKLTPKIRGRIYETDLKAQGVIDFGKLKRNGFGNERLPSYLEVFIDGKPGVLARWPNTTLLPIDQVVNSGTSKELSAGTNGPQIVTSTEEISKWPTVKDVWVAGYMSASWSYDNFPVESFDQNTKVLSLRGKSNYKISKTSVNNAGDIFSRGIYFYNIFEELDAENEWYLDQQQGKLFVVSEGDVKGKNIGVSILESPIFRLNKASNVTISNIEFALTRGSAVQIANSHNITIKDCKFRNLGLVAVDVTSSESVLIEDCEISQTGSGGIIMGGGNRRTLKSGKNTISNCDISNYSRLYQSYSPAIQLEGVGGVVSNCEIHDAPDQAIIFKGNNHQIINNHIYNVCGVYDDIGAVYTGRDPSSAGTKITDNLFENIGYNGNGRVAAIYIDDGSGGITISGNTFFKTGPRDLKDFGAIQINGGSDNKMRNNIFINCSKAYSVGAWSNAKWAETYLGKNSLKSRLVKDVDIRSSTYIEAYPHLADFFDTTKVKARINYIENTVAFGTKKIVTGKGYQIKNVSDKSSISVKSVQDIKELELPEEVKKWANWDRTEPGLGGRKRR
ncbi:right-handed parallel beta-helix repeat-containing protein [Dyadobacter aurulentus]|uniref:right-handed parallel beta-helix repeat-containing protein n=1 Tax=Dyadobacter sp. UC 10 TaxID=2605428 RepID=UPI0011F1D008|nr:right-handed parallel beta-helix repeat-containing protein [Dyadobacter sp. UC 10]KAA0988877.1 right-handed parallel beta-helix repeat-containing protein [Dyadobacter sp. UC 10]